MLTSLIDTFNTEIVQSNYDEFYHARSVSMFISRILRLFV